MTQLKLKWRPIEAIVASLCGSATQSLLMSLKKWLDVLPTFQPYEHLQLTMAAWLGGSDNRILWWLLPYVSGALVIGTLFGWTYRFLPAGDGWVKGCYFGLMAWAVVGLMFFPALGFGLFAAKVGLGVLPALLSLVMLVVYGAVMGSVYAWLDY